MGNAWGTTPTESVSCYAETRFFSRLLRPAVEKRFLGRNLGAHYLSDIALLHSIMSAFGHIMELQANTAFFIFWVCFFMGILLCRIPERLPRQVLGRWECLLPRLSGHRRHKWVTIPHRTLHYWDHQRVTLFHYVILLFYAAGNGLFFLNAEDLKEVQRRAAIACILNLVPVILAGRTRLLADALNLSFQQHYLVHHWFAWIAIVEAVIHAGIIVRGGMPKTGQSTCGLLVRPTTPQFLRLGLTRR